MTSEETGKDPADVLVSEVLPSLVHLSYVAREAERVLSPRKVSPRPVLTKSAWVRYSWGASRAGRWSVCR